MIRKDSSSASKVLLLFLAVLLSAPLMAQRRPGIGGFAQEFLKTQWWLGLRFGVNYTNPVPVTRYSAFSPVNYEEESLDKQYKSYSLPGAQAGLDITFYHKGFMVGVQPTYKRNRYMYSNTLHWEGQEAEANFETSYELEQRIDILEVPLTLKYEILHSGKARPYITAGGYYAFVTSAEKRVDITLIDESTGSPQETSGGTLILGVKDQFRNYAGILGGVGVGLDYWNIRTVVEATYLKGLTDITRDKTRFTENELTSIGDVNDEIRMDQVNVSISFVFPLRYIDKQFQAY